MAKTISGMPDAEYELKQLVFEKVRMRYGAKMPAHIMRNMKVHTMFDYYSDNMLVEMELLLTGHKWTDVVRKPTTIKVPKTWFDAFRECYFPKFLTKRYPIKYRVFEDGGTIVNNTWILPEVPPNLNPDVTAFLVSYGASQQRSE